MRFIIIYTISMVHMILSIFIKWNRNNIYIFCCCICLIYALHCFCCDFIYRGQGKNIQKVGSMLLSIDKYSTTLTIKTLGRHFFHLTGFFFGIVVYKFDNHMHYINNKHDKYLYLHHSDKKLTIKKL
jgi:hypothetical protein